MNRSGLLFFLYATLFAGIAAGLIGCSDDKKSGGSVQKASDATTEQAPPSTDRSDAQSTARAILLLYQKKDLGGLAGLVSAKNRDLFVELAAKATPTHDIPLFLANAVGGGWR